MTLYAMRGAARRLGGQSVWMLLVILTARPPVRLTAQDSLPAGYGTLRRDDIAVRLTTDQPDIQVHQLDAREQAVAIYLFDEGISFREDVTVSYQSLASGAWSRSLRALDRERARVLARVRAGR